VNAYAGYSEGSRAPTSIELGCADPTQPCKLPNAMAGDPPLRQVFTRTWEGGLRGRPGQEVTWTVGVFHADNREDILFVASTQTGFGFFKNFGSTRRQGVEIGMQGRVKQLTVGTGYTYLDATYQSDEMVNGSSNSTNDVAAAGGKGLDGAIAIHPGDRIPLVPRHLLKAFADVQATPKLSLGLDLVVVSSAFARGNENNRNQPDGTYYLGPGASPGYAVTNLGARYQLNATLQFIAQINNLFDHHYDTAAQLGPTGFTETGAFIARPFPPVGGEFPLQHSTFFAPGAPRAFSVGTRFKF
jgi:outer membrane receptor protein involved in Fe transport